METITIIDIIRLLTGVIILAYASYTDIKTRRAANYLWVIIAIIGIALLIIQTLAIGLPNIYYLLLIPALIILFYVLFQLRLIFGGADAKALMSLAILVPLKPSIEIFPLFSETAIDMPGAWSIFINSILIFLIIPIGLFIYNIITRNIQFPYCFLGYKTTIEKAKKSFVWPLEKIQDGKRKFSYMPKQFDIDDELKAFEQLEIKELWVTPKIPFMIPLLVGFITTFIIGDLLLILMQIFLLP